MFFHENDLLFFFYLVNDSQKRLFFPKKQKICMFFTWLVFQISTIFHDFSIEIPRKPRFFPRSLQKLAKIGKNWKIHVFSLTPISNFHGFP